MAPCWHPFGDVMGLRWLALQLMHASSFKGNRSSIISMIWCRFWCHFCAFPKSPLLKTHIILEGRLAPSMHPFSFPSFPFARASAAKHSEALAWSRPRRRPGPKTTSEALSVLLLSLDTIRDLPVLCNIASTIVLSFFWQLRFF